MDYNQMHDAALQPQTLALSGRHRQLASIQLFSHRQHQILKSQVGEIMYLFYYHNTGIPFFAQRTRHNYSDNFGSVGASRVRTHCMSKIVYTPEYASKDDSYSPPASKPLSNRSPSSDSWWSCSKQLSDFHALDWCNHHVPNISQPLIKAPHDRGSPSVRRLSLLPALNKT